MNIVLFVTVEVDCGELVLLQDVFLFSQLLFFLFFVPAEVPAGSSQHQWTPDWSSSENRHRTERVTVQTISQASCLLFFV